MINNLFKMPLPHKKFKESAGKGLEAHLLVLSRLRNSRSINISPCASPTTEAYARLTGGGAISLALALRQLQMSESQIEDHLHMKLTLNYSFEASYSGVKCTELISESQKSGALCLFPSSVPHRAV